MPQEREEIFDDENLNASVDKKAGRGRIYDTGGSLDKQSVADP